MVLSRCLSQDLPTEAGFVSVGAAPYSVGRDRVLGVSLSFLENDALSPAPLLLAALFARVAP